MRGGSSTRTRWHTHVIEELVRRRMVYQKTVFIIEAGLLVLAGGVWTIFTETNSHTADPQLAEQTASVSSAEHSSYAPSAGASRGKVDLPRTMRMDWVNARIRIIREPDPVQVSIPVRGDTSRDEFPEILPSSHTGEEIAAGSSGGTLWDEDAPFMPPTASTVRSFDFPSSQPEGVHILLAPIRWPTIAKVADTGLVAIALVVDHKGRIEWEVLYEEPKSRGFAGAVIESLKSSRFTSARRQGLDTVMILTTLCLDCPPHYETRGNLTVSCMSGSE